MNLSVKVILHDASGKVLILRRSPSSKHNAGKWEFPGGKTEPCEKFDDAILREVHEETGLVIKLGGSFSTCDSPGAAVPLVYLIMEASIDTHAPDITLSNEHDRFEWVEPAKLDDKPLCPQFRRVARRYAQDVRFYPRIPTPPPAPKPPKLFENSLINPDSLTLHLKSFIDPAEANTRTGLADWFADYLRKNARAICPTAEVSARSKDPASFAGKLIKKNKYVRPLTEMTDLVGARVVVHLLSEVNAISNWIEQTFDVDKANSLDTLSRLGPDKFGYRSVHYVVQLRPGKPDKVKLPPGFVGRKIEIQVRTIAQHAWSDIGHDRTYKADCDIPEYWQRESNRIAALLEAADEAFARLITGIDAYRQYAHSASSALQLNEQLQLWDVVRTALPGHPGPTLRYCRLARQLEKWTDIIAACKGFTDPLLEVEHGLALCKSAPNRNSTQWKQGAALIRRATEVPSTPIEAYLTLGQLLADDRPAESITWYERALTLDPTNPAALEAYVRLKIQTTTPKPVSRSSRTPAPSRPASARYSSPSLAPIPDGPLDFLTLIRPQIHGAIQRCMDLAAANADLPASLYRAAFLHLLTDTVRNNTALELLARAIHQTRVHAAPLIQALRDVESLTRHLPNHVDLQCSFMLLSAALQAKFPDEYRRQADHLKPPATPLKATHPVVIIAGGCDSYHKHIVDAYHESLSTALHHFAGTIISGGTREGISGLVAKIAQASKKRIRPVGYLPQYLPKDNTATRDPRYEKLGVLRTTTGPEDYFSSRQPLQNWLDLLAAGVHPSDVRLLGINGGNIAGLEYRIAVALGAKVAVIENSGREAERVLEDWPAQRTPSTSATATPDTAPVGSLTPIPNDPATLRAFLLSGKNPGHPLDENAISSAAQLIHADFLDQNRYDHPNPVMQPWPKLRPDLQYSNRNQVEYLVRILSSAGFIVQPVRPNAPSPHRIREFTDDEVTRMGEQEHGRWNLERLQSGWRKGKPKDPVKLISPYLVPWNDLDDTIKGYDFKNVRLWPEILAAVGYEIVRSR